MRPLSKKKYSKMIVGLIIAMNTAFAVAALYVFLRTEEEPSTLIGCWFAFTTGELWMLSGIKKTEVKTESKQEKIKEEVDI